MQIVSARRGFEASFIIGLEAKEQFSFQDGNRRIWVKRVQIQFDGETQEDAMAGRAHVKCSDAYQIRADSSLGRKIPSYIYVPPTEFLGKLIEQLRRYDFVAAEVPVS